MTSAARSVSALSLAHGLRLPGAPARSVSASAGRLTRFPLSQGWYIVTYALGIYHLNLFIAFLSPKVDPSLMEDSGRRRPRAAQGRPVLRKRPREPGLCCRRARSRVLAFRCSRNDHGAPDSRVRRVFPLHPDVQAKPRHRAV